MDSIRKNSTKSSNLANEVQDEANTVFRLLKQRFTKFDVYEMYSIWLSVMKKYVLPCIIKLGELSVENWIILPL